MTSPYTDQIQKLAPMYDWRHIEAYMRIEHGTLDHLTPRRFASEVAFCKQCVDMSIEDAEKLALSYGF